MIGENELRPDWNSVKADCRDGAVQMMAHLIECGHKNIGILCGKTPENEVKSILQGCKNVLKANGRSLPQSHIQEVENSIEGGYIGAKKMIVQMTTPDSEKQGDKLDALFATSDEIAYGAMDAIKDCGLSIPDDVAIAGFGNYIMSSLMEPKLTTVEEPYRLMGIYGARILFDLIEEKSEMKEPPKHIILKKKMRVRKSCGHKERIGEMF